MIYSIDKFEVNYAPFTVTFVRVNTGLGWYGTFPQTSQRWGDFVMIDTSLSKEGIIEMFEVLASQAADSLTRVYKDAMGTALEREPFTRFLQQEIKKKAL